MKLGEIAQLHKNNTMLETLLKEKDETLSKTEENLKKSELCVEGLSEVCKEQSEAIAKKEKELKVKAMTLEKMIKEYEIVKAKVRQYRAERASNSMDSQPDSGVFEKHSTISKQQKSIYVKHGAEKALIKAQNLYNDHLQQFEDKHHSIMNMMRKRLEELAEFISTLLNNGLLNISNLDESIRDVLQKSLNESRNLSIATFEDTLAEDQCDLMVPFPRIEINIDEIDLDVDTVNDVSEVIEEYKKAHEEDMATLKAELDHLRNEKLENESLTKQRDELERHLSELKQKFEFDVAVKQKHVEELRVKCGNSNEKSRKLQEEVDKLKDKTKAVKELSKLQTENQELKQQIQKDKKAVEVAVSEYKTANEKLVKQKATDDFELQDLRAKLAQANAKLREHKERQEKVDKAMRVQLAKTHKVLKRTKENIDTNLK